MPPNADSIHRTAADGYAEAADAYVAGRPDYPSALAAWLRDALDLQPGRSVVDLGAGTGKFTPLLLATGARVIAIEPVAAMRAKLAAAQPDAEVLTGTATAIPLPDGTVDAVVCAQSFHWFANTAALVEIHRVLKPGGRLGLVWNQRDASVGWVAQLDRLVNVYEGDAPRHTSGVWRAAFVDAAFGPLCETRFGHEHNGRVEDMIVNRVLSTSFIAASAPATRAEVTARVRALIAAEPALCGKTEVTMPYLTTAFCTIRQDSQDMAWPR